MDPSMCLAKILSELNSPLPDRDRVIQLLEALYVWVKNGGFLPQAADWNVIEQARRIVESDTARG